MPYLAFTPVTLGGEVIRTWLGDLEEAVGVAGRVRGIDRGARLDLIERLHRRRGRAGRRERPLGESRRSQQEEDENEEFGFHGGMPPFIKKHARLTRRD
jgi:hypothetical protein